MAEKKEIMKYGVKKEKIQIRIDTYRRLLEEDLATETKTGLNVLKIQLKEILEQIVEAENNSASPDVLAELETKRKEIEAEIETKSESKYIKAEDVVEEVEYVLDNASAEYTFVEIEVIEKRIEYYKNLLASLDMNGLTKRRDELIELIEKEKTELERLRREKEEQDKKKEEKPEDKKDEQDYDGIDSEFVAKARDAAIADLVSRISNREATIVGYEPKMQDIKFQELEAWKKELEELRAGKVTQEILDAARAAEIKDLEERIANRNAMLAARDMPQHKWDELAEWEKRLEELKNPNKGKDKPEDKDPEQKGKEGEESDLDAKIKELEELIARHETELEEVKKQIVELEGRDPSDVAEQRRVVQHRIEELEEIAKEKELFKITDKGEVIIEYPPIKPEIDEEAIREEYEYRRTDMLDKYYGNADKKYEYEERMEYFKSHIEEVEFEFIDEKGNKQVGTYQRVKPYEGMENDLAFLQLEEYPERLERKTRYEAGDMTAYDEVRDTKGRLREPDEVFAEDSHYIDTNNSAYNRLIATHENLKTLGKYGEKVDYTPFQEGQPGRNIFRAVGNVAKFIRNHTTAPINKAIGKYIVAPIYGAITKPDERVAGLYSNKFTHRYVARREYFASQGKGYFASRWNSIFNAKEGNKAILSAGAYDIKQSIKSKYQQLAEQEARRKQTEFASKKLDEQVAMIEEDLAKATDPENIARLEATLKDLKLAQQQVAKDALVNEQKAITSTRQTDAVDMDTHDIANKENVTRTVTGVKMLARFGIRKFIGPKLKEWLIERTKVPQEVETVTQVPQERQEWVPATYKEVRTPVYETVSDNGATMSEVMASNAGKEVEGFYSVYGGERRPKIYELTGNEKVTSVFQSVGKGGTGLSDTAGLTAPTLTDRTFMGSLLDANGVLNQDVTVDGLISALGTGTVDPETLAGVYVSVGDRYWVKLADLVQGATRQVQVGETISQVVDVPGHFKTITEMVDQVTRTTQMVDNVRVIEALKTMGVVVDVADKGLLAEDIYENVRTTDTEVDPTKPQPRNYTYDAGFTGKKSEDYESKFAKGKDDGEER